MKKRIKTLSIQGLHCLSCELNLEQKIKEIPEVLGCKASHKKKALKIKYQGDFPDAAVKKTIKDCDCVLIKNNKNVLEKTKNSTKDYLQIGLIALALLMVAFVFKKMEISRFLPNFGNQISVLIAFSVGIVASLSTCLALIGGIVMSFGSTYPMKEDRRLSFGRRSLPHLYFHAGRIGGFMLLGGILGSIGNRVNYSFSFAGILTVVIALVMLFIGLKMLNLLPNLTKFEFGFIKKPSILIQNLQKKESPGIPALIGALTFFLPCGFTQSMQLAAIASQSFVFGSLIMGAFALGTMPVLFLIGFGSSFSQIKNFGFAKKIVGVLIISLAFYSLNSGLILVGNGALLSAGNKKEQLNNPAEKDQSAKRTGKENIQIVKMEVSSTFNPKEFKIKKDIPVRWEIYGKNLTGCSNEVIISKLNITSGKLKPGLNVVEFTATEKGTLAFSCWMGMIKGKFIVEG